MNDTPPTEETPRAEQAPTATPVEQDRSVLPTDHRLYLPQPDGWKAHIKMSAEKEYCYFKNPGEDYFHLLLVGELYLEFEGEFYCLNCATRRGVLTSNRLFWQHPRR